MSSAEFEPAIPANERPQNQALDGAVAGGRRISVGGRRNRPVKSRDLGKAGLWLAGGLVRAGAGLWWANGKERDRLEELDLEGTIKFKCIFKILNGTAWSGLIWLRIATGGGLL
jgi:hypothetical protein